MPLVFLSCLVSFCLFNESTSHLGFAYFAVFLAIFKQIVMLAHTDDLALVTNDVEVTNCVTGFGIVLFSLDLWGQPEI